VPSPFPGMDPFIERQRWRDFHTRYITVLSDLITDQVRPRYVVDVEEYVYLARDEDGRDVKLIEPDVSVSQAVGGDTIHSGGTIVAEPTIYTMPQPARIRQPFLAIRDRRGRDVVTVVEVLSPWNKTAGRRRNEYLAKRDNVLAAHSHLVEIDLLHGGVRLPAIEPLQPADYYAFVCRRERSPQVEVFAWNLRESLPCVPVPLMDTDPDAVMDLQHALVITYDRGGYDYALDYESELSPSADPELIGWISACLE